MKSKKDEERYWRNASLPIAAFLFAKGEQIAGVNEVNDSGDKEFCFVRTPELEGLVEAYKYGDKEDERLLVDVHHYEEARKRLLDRINGR